MFIIWAILRENKKEGVILAEIGEIGRGIEDQNIKDF
jgi:hypothetical protein